MCVRKEGQREKETESSSRLHIGTRSYDSDTMT